MSRKLITVLGATGAQGGGLVDSLLATSDFKIRAVTRDVKSAQSQALAKKGVEVVEGNILKPDTIKEAFKGAYGVFAVTNFWEKDQLGKEFEIGKNLVDAAKEAKVTHFIWSTLANCQTESKGKYHVVHFTDKAKVEAYAREAKFHYHTYIAAPYYYQNWGTFVKPQKAEDGSYSFTLNVPATTMWSQGDVREVGIAVATAFRNPQGWGNGDYIAVCAEHVPLSSILEVFSQHLGKKVTLNVVPTEAFSKFFPGAEELGEMFEWFNEYGYFGKTHDITSGHKAKGSALKSFAEYLKETNFAFK